MAVKIVIPREGQSMETALISEWSVKIGDTVEFGDVLCDVESEKASFPIESPVSGVVLDIFFEAGIDAPVLETIAVIGKPGDDYEHLKPGAAGEKEESSAVKEEVTDTKVEESVKSVIKSDRGTKKKMSPKARMMAKKEKEQNSLSGMRKVIADNILESVQSTAQFTLHISADAGNLLKQYKNLKTKGDKKVSLNDIILLVVIKTLVSYPDLNATFDGTSYTKSEDINLGFAVGVSEGLMVPVIIKAQDLDLDAIAKKAASLVDKCRKSLIKTDELKNGTFTVSNLGMYNIEKFTPILNYPEVGILGVGGIFPKAVRQDEGIEFIDCIEFSLTLNHQIIDGVKGAKFLNELAETIKGLDLEL